MPLYFRPDAAGSPGLAGFTASATFLIPPHPPPPPHGAGHRGADRVRPPHAHLLLRGERSSFFGGPFSRPFEGGLLRALSMGRKALFRRAGSAPAMTRLPSQGTQTPGRKEGPFFFLKGPSLPRWAACARISIESSGRPHLWMRDQA